MPAKTVIQLRRDTAANWTSANPVLAAGEAGVESDTNKFKIGDGTSTWSQLSYFLNADDLPSPVSSINTRTTSYTAQAGDANNIIEMNSTLATTVTIPADSTLNLPVGTSIDIVNVNTGEVVLASEIPSGPAPSNGSTWITVSSNFGFNQITSMAYGHSLWVAAGYYGQMRTSTNGSTWTTVTSNFGVRNILSIAYGNGLWIAVGDYGQIRTSTNGSTWATVTSNFESIPLASVAYGNGLWIAGGQNGEMRTSTNGSTWVTVTSNLQTGVRSVAYGNGLWVAGGAGGGMMQVFTNQVRISTNGVTWTTASSDFGLAIVNSIAYGNGLWAVGTQNGQMFNSTNGSVWVTVTSNLDVVNSIAYGNGRWMAGGWYKLATSTNGSAWTTATSNFDSNSSIYSVALGNNLWIAGGQNGEMRTSQPIIQIANPAILSKDSNKKIASQYGAATAYKRAANEWVVIGDLSA